MPLAQIEATFLGLPIQIAGAGCFGAIIGWYLYYINRYRRADVQLGDVVTLIGAIGGGAVLSLFDKKSDLFGAYGIGLFLGFFAYFLMLMLFVLCSMWGRGEKNFNLEWFLDGRRKEPRPPWGYPPDGTGRGAMALPDAHGNQGGPVGGH